jgi:hypothetical protein
MKKEDAIKILETNIYRELCVNWFKFSFIFIAISIVSGLLGFFLPLPTIILEPSLMKAENIIPAIFTATITAISILIGFFTVSAFNFRQWLESRIEKGTDDFFEARKFYRNAKAKQVELEKIMKENEKKETLEEIEKEKVETEDEIKECEALIELTELNHDAYAHQQEHLGKFVVTFISVSFSILIFELITFLATLVTTWFIGIFVFSTLFSLLVVFCGLGVFMDEFLTYATHKERI